MFKKEECDKRIEERGQDETYSVLNLEVELENCLKYAKSANEKDCRFRYRRLRISLTKLERKLVKYRDHILYQMRTWYSRHPDEVIKKYKEYCEVELKRIKNKKPKGEE